MVDEKRKQSLKTLSEEREKHLKKFKELQSILQDVENTGYNGRVPKNVKKYVRKKQLKNDVRLHHQLVCDLNNIIIAMISAENKEVKIIGSIYGGTVYQELLDSIKKAELKFSEETYMVSIE